MRVITLASAKNTLLNASNAKFISLPTECFLVNILPLKLLKRLKKKSNKEPKMSYIKMACARRCSRRSWARAMKNSRLENSRMRQST